MNILQEDGWHMLSAPKKRTRKQYSKYPVGTNQSEIELHNCFRILQDIDNQSTILYDNNRVKVNIAGYL